MKKSKELKTMEQITRDNIAYIKREGGSFYILINSIKQATVNGLIDIIESHEDIAYDFINVNGIDKLRISY